MKEEIAKQVQVYAYNNTQQILQFAQTEKVIYGSSRLGTNFNPIPLFASQNSTQPVLFITHNIGLSTYELTNHLGNVLSVISDKPIPHQNGQTVDYWQAEVRQATDYSPFGVQLQTRNLFLTVLGNVPYRFGFNSMEKDDEIKGSGNSYDFGARMLDPRLGRWLTIDPLAGKQPSFSPYKAFLNSPVIFNDPDGKDEFLVIIVKSEKSGAQLRIAVPKPITNFVRAGNIREAGNSTTIYEKQNYYDFKTVVTITVGSDGKTSTDIIHYTLTESKRYSKTMFSSIVNGVKTGAIVDPNGWDLEGSGETQKGGYTLTTKSGVVSPSKTKAMEGALELEVDYLIGLVGGMKGNINTEKYEKYSDIADAIDKFVDFVESIQDNSSDDESGEVEIVEPIERTSGIKDTIWSKQSRKDADAFERGGGKYNKTKDTIIAPIQKKY